MLIKNSLILASAALAAAQSSSSRPASSAQRTSSAPSSVRPSSSVSRSAGSSSRATTVSRPPASQTISRPNHTSTPAPSYTGQPCAVISDLVAADFEDFIPAKIAFDCLNSVPVDVEGNKLLIEELKLLWEWESEGNWYKTVPSDYENGPSDLIGSLDKIKGNLTAFPSEFAVQLAIWAVTVNTGNYHINYNPDILRVFKWFRLDGVASLSDDGKQLPKLYSTSDIVEWEYLAENGFTISNIVKINGQDAYAFLEDEAHLQNYIETDARLNKLFFKSISEESLGSFQTPPQYVGPTTNYTFANGSSIEYLNFASTSQDWTGVKDGKTFFDTFCDGSISGFDLTTLLEKKNQVESLRNKGALGPQPRIPATYHQHVSKRQEINPFFYPEPVVQHSKGVLAGYFLNQPGYTDVAVLKIISFDVPELADWLEFQSDVKDFLSKATAAKKTKLVIDVRENGGGSTTLLIDTFRQLFPKDEAFSAQQYRVHEQYAAMGDSVNEIYTNKKFNDEYKKLSESDLETDFRHFAWWQFTTIENKNFKDWQEFAGPYTANNDLFTSTWRYNTSNADAATSSVRIPGFKFTETNNAQQVFDKKNVVLFTDGLCGSACASFHEELKNIAGIKSVVIGGRSKAAPMQAVSGTKGGEVVPLNKLPVDATKLILATEAIGATTVLDTEVLDLALSLQVLIRAGDEGSRIQLQDQLRKGDASGIPLQFIYEASDCKIFYTQQTLFNPSDAWAAAWNAFTDDKKCVDGSTKHKSSISGGFKPYGSGPVKVEDCGHKSSAARPSYTGTTRIHTGRPTATPTPIKHNNGTVSTRPTSRATGVTTRPTISPSGRPSNSTLRSSSRPSNSTRPVTVSTRPITINTPATSARPTTTASGRASTSGGISYSTPSANTTRPGVPVFTGAAGSYGVPTTIFGLFMGGFAAALL